jgi:hypothetical protein
MKPLMKKIIPVACTVITLAAASAAAQFPIQNMGMNRLGLAYDLAFAGQNITEQNVPSQQSTHSLSLGYAPIPYAGLTLGLGIARFQTESTGPSRAFDGRYAFSPSLGLRLVSPGFIHETFYVIGGVYTQYFNSEDKNGLGYSAFVVNPDLGLMISPFNFFDLRLGGRLHVLNGDIDVPRASSTSPFSNETVARGYLGVTLKTPAEGAFLSIDVDLSPESDANWSRGPVESTLRITMGTVLGWKSREPKATPRNPYFPNYRDLKDRQEQMSDELQSD